MMDNRPDLPELESVEAYTYALLFFPCMVLMCLLPAIAFMIQSFTKHGLPHELSVKAIVNSVLTVGFAVSAAVSALAANYHWKTDSDGLTVKGLFRRRFIKWSDFGEAATRTNWVGERIYVLKTNVGTVSIPAAIPMNGWQENALIASIWQHLRRYGKADGLNLSDVALSLWDVIPDELPDQLEWRDPRQVRLVILVLALMVALCFLVLVVFPIIREGSYVMAALGLLFIGVISWSGYSTEIRPALRMASSVRVRNECIDAQIGRATVRIPWSEIRDVRWDCQKHRLRMRLRGQESDSEMVIRVNPRDDDSLRIVLAIIRNLRSSSTPVALTIPPICRSQSSPNIQSVTDAKAEVRLTPTERAMATGFVLMLGLTAIMLPTNGTASIYQIAGTLLVSTLIGWVASGTYTLRADENGIGKWVLGTRRLVPWEQIAEVAEQRDPNRPYVPRRVLKNAKGRILMDITLGFGPQQDRERFRALVSARLAGTIAPDRLDKPWKSKPWTPAQ